MLEENSGSEPQENIEQSAQTGSQDSVQDSGDNINSQEKVYSQKQRKRAQVAEAENEKLKARIKKIEEDSLAEQGKFKEMWERDKGDAEWARDYQKSKKASLIDKLPEDKRDKFKSLNLEALEAVVEELVQNKPSQETMKAVPGQISPPTLDKPYEEMTEAEREAHHKAIINSRNQT